MRFIETPLKGACTIELEKHGDERGFFARVFCENEFQRQGLATRFVQINNSLSAERGTLRGMHYQLPPDGEVKVVRCVRGSLYDVIVDLRPKSPTYKKWFGVELTAENRTMLYVPVGFAHGFITTSDDTEVLYLMGNFYKPEAERGFRYDDPTIGIAWPIAPAVLSAKDAAHPYFSEQYHVNDLLREMPV